MGDDNDCTEALIPVLLKLKSLTQISLNFGVSSLTHAKNLVQLFLNLSKIEALLYIMLDLSFCSILKEDDATEPLAEGLQCRNPSSIRKLSLALNGDLTGQGLIQISQVLSTFNSLEILYLDTNRAGKITDVGVAELSSTSSNLGSLISLGLSFPHTRQPQKTVQYISLALKSLRNLIHLKLSFPGDSTSHDQVLMLSSSLRAFKSSLRFLDLNFSMQESLSDSTVQNLSETLKELTLLKHLTLNFQWFPR